MLKRVPLLAALAVVACLVAPTPAQADDCPAPDGSPGAAERFAEDILRRARQTGAFVLVGGRLQCLRMSVGRDPREGLVLRSLCGFDARQQWTSGAPGTALATREGVVGQRHYILGWSRIDERPSRDRMFFMTPSSRPNEVHVFERLPRSEPRVMRHAGHSYPLVAMQGECGTTLADTPGVRAIARSLGFRVPDGPAR